MNFLNLANGLSAPNANLNLWSRKVGLEHDDYLQQLFCGGTQSIALRQKQPQEMFCKKRPATYKKKMLWQVFSCCEFSSKNTFCTDHLWTTAILLRDFIFQPFSMIDFISPTIKGHYMKCICSKCFREGITKSWIYYQFAARTAVKNVPLGLY